MLGTCHLVRGTDSIVAQVRASEHSLESRIRLNERSGERDVVETVGGG